MTLRLLHPLAACVVLHLVGAGATFAFLVEGIVSREVLVVQVDELVVILPGPSICTTGIARALAATPAMGRQGRLLLHRLVCCLRRKVEGSAIVMALD